MLIVGGVLTALISALGAYLLAARRMSGRIETSSAKELWDESKAIREDYRIRIDHMALRAAELEDRIARVDLENVVLTRKAMECAATIKVLEATIEELREAIEKRGSGD